MGLALQAQTASPSPVASPAASGFPGGHAHGGEGHGGMLEHLTKALNLSDDQKAKVAAILEQEKPQFEALRQEHQAKMKALIDDASSKITPLLNADQQTKFAALVQQRESGGGRRFGRGPGGPGGFGGHGGPGGAGGRGAVLEKMVTELGLTQDQQNQIKPILEAAKTQIQTIRANDALSQDEKMAQLKDVWQGVQGQVNGLLTADQQQKLATLKASHHRRGPGAQPSPSASPAAQ